MDEYRNPLFDEYNEASTSLLHQKSDNHSNSTHNMSKAGVDFQVDDTHDANIQSRNSSCLSLIRFVLLIKEEHI